MTARSSREQRRLKFVGRRARNSEADEEPKGAARWRNKRRTNSAAKDVPQSETIPQSAADAGVVRRPKRTTPARRAAPPPQPAAPTCSALEDAMAILSSQLTDMMASIARMRAQIDAVGSGAALDVLASAVLSDIRARPGRTWTQIARDLILRESGTFGQARSFLLAAGLVTESEGLVHPVAI